MLGAWGRRHRELFNGYGVSVLQDERVLEMDGGDDYTTTITFNINTQHKYIHGW